MQYAFDGEIAKLYGADEAVFIHNLYWWIAKNEANGRHYYDGRWWTYNSMEAFVKLFPFLSLKQIRRIINKLRDNGAIYVGNYNKSTFDKTQWYALSETVNSIYSNGLTDAPKQALPSAQTGTPIPDSKPDSKPDNIPPLPPTGGGERSTYKTRFETFWRAYPKKVGKGAAERAFERQRIDDALLQTVIDALAAQKQSEQWTRDGGQYIPNPATWLNQMRWQDELPGLTEQPDVPRRTQYKTIIENGKEVAVPVE